MATWKQPFKNSNLFSQASVQSGGCWTQFPKTIHEQTRVKSGNRQSLYSRIFS